MTLAASNQINNTLHGLGRSMSWMAWWGWALVFIVIVILICAAIRRYR